MFQTRSEETGIGQFATLEEAIQHAKTDVTVWKISFEDSTGERVRLVRDGEVWVLDQMSWHLPV